MVIQLKYNLGTHSLERLINLDLAVNGLCLHVLAKQKTICHARQPEVISLEIPRLTFPHLRAISLIHLVRNLKRLLLARRGKVISQSHDRNRSTGDLAQTSHSILYGYRMLTIASLVGRKSERDSYQSSDHRE